MSTSRWCPARTAVIAAMTDWFLFFLCTLVVARVSRWVWLDTQLQGTRIKVKAWLQLGHMPEDVVGTAKAEEWLNEYHKNHPTRDFLRHKAYQLIECPWCLSMWISGPLVAILAAADWFWDAVSIPLPLLWWPALSMAAVVLLQWTDGAFNVEVTQKK